MGITDKRPPPPDKTNVPSITVSVYRSTTGPTEPEKSTSNKLETFTDYYGPLISELEDKQERLSGQFGFSMETE